MRNFDLSPLLRASVGFDRFDKLFETAFGEAAREQTYPPYNIVKNGKDTYRVTLAVAGFGPEDVDITVHENQLIVKGQISRPEQGVEYLYRGIAQRAFEHRFQLADHVQVVSANLVNGLLDVQLKREVPEALQPKKISIGAEKTAQPKVIEQQDNKAAA
ncbi:Hsp20 family protein [Geminicoccus roseus]|uniref:Hsp20 family protein n=1 Tax=Geminicoccus roseus TaxID=404900 RepID=UPI0003F63FC8|nr:Hsp20 family protein [Geminicoccus roseus]